MDELNLHKVLHQTSFSREDLVFLLAHYDQVSRKKIYEKANTIRTNSVGSNIYLRGLIEYSNICKKNCLYCGIRAANSEVSRYCLSEDEVIECAKYAATNNYASLVIQSGEVANKSFTDEITSLLKRIHKETKNRLVITLSCGEQKQETYQRWFDAGARRYLLRIESSNRELFEQIHPKNSKHSYDTRLNALEDLRSTGYQLGTGVMIGLPGQQLKHLADDLLFFKELDVDMVGMGPFIEHVGTPLYEERSSLLKLEYRYNLSLLMISLLRIMMPEINIASTTALDAIFPGGRMEALQIASNVLMPNLTPFKYSENYHLYNNKPDSMHADQLVRWVENNGQLDEMKIAFGEQGNSIHFDKRQNE